MTSEERVLNREYQRGREAAKAVQANADNMTGTELNAAGDRIPRFAAAVAAKNMMERPAGQTGGFVCRSSAGRVVRLLQNYDSATYLHEDGTPWEPEELPAQWGFKWSTDPAKAKPFISLSTSPYNTGDCCTYDGKTWRSGQDGNVWAPGTPNVKWDEVQL